MLLLLFTQLARLEAERLRKFSGPLYPLLCQLWCTEVRYTKILVTQLILIRWRLFSKCCCSTVKSTSIELVMGGVSRLKNLLAYLTFC